MGNNSDDDDDWETDPDYVNNMSEEQQRWGGARDTGTLDMDKFREEIKDEDSAQNKVRQQEEGYKSSTGYGGTFGVQTDRMDKSALGHDYIGKVDKHVSQKDYKTGFGGKFGIQEGRQDKAALGWDHIEKVDKHISQKDYKTGFGGQFGVQSDRVDKSALGWDHTEKATKHESQLVDRGADKASFVDEGQGSVGTNYVKTKPDIPMRTAGKLKSRFESMAQESEAEAKKKSEEEKKRREAKDARDKEDSVKVEEKRKAAMDVENERREGVRKAEAQKLDREMEAKRIKEEKEFKRRDEEEMKSKNAALERQQQMDAEMKLREDKLSEEKRLREEDKNRMEQKLREDKENDSREREIREQERRREEELAIKRNEEEKKRQEEVDRRRHEEEERRREEENVKNAPRYDNPPEDEVYDNMVEEDDNEDIYDNMEPNPPSPKGAGISAVALYDYQAMAEDEISFDPNDTITNIEMVDEGWWIGECHGRFGLFPANYVQVQGQ